MLASTATLPPLWYEAQAQRKDGPGGGLDQFVLRASRRLTRPVRRLTVRTEGRDLVERAAALEDGLRSLTDDALLARVSVLRTTLRETGLAPAALAEGFALVREQAGRTLGMRHFDSQLLGGLALLQGAVAEMETGEGKTLTATLTASVAALAGIPVHVITVNDYLTTRDAEWMGQLYASLGLTVGCVKHGQSPEERRAAYQCDITYATNKEIVFDYLRDRMKLGDRTDPCRLHVERLYSQHPRSESLLLRGLHFAIVDEADSILVDEARTPLIISGSQGGEEKAFLEEALKLSQGLTQEQHYRVDEHERDVELTDAGKDLLAQEAERLGPLWKGKRRREETVTKGLEAVHLFHRDEHYLVRDGRVEIVDEFTGRVMPDRAWERGLHQLIELKEDCDMTAARETLARISYQRFFKRYIHLSGMTGTASEVEGELSDVYGLSVIKIPTNRPVIREQLPDRLFASLDTKWSAVAARVRTLHEQGRPVLVGTRSVAASEHLAALLEEEKLPHTVLNAKFDDEEADIIAGAGEPGRITIATNMAGRGTDIKLGAAVAERGGLHVILTERHEAARIDRQLAGRCGRQGDPGSHEAILSLEDPLLAGGRGGIPAWLAGRLPVRSRVWRFTARWAIRTAQTRLQRLHARIRRDLLKADQQRGGMLSFSGRPE